MVSETGARALQRATAVTRRTLEWFPIRVWRHFLQHNGFLLSAGVSYQALFAAFATVYVVFASVGLWLGGSQEAVNGLIDLINSYIPGIISNSGGLFTPAQVTRIATGSSGVLSITGAIAAGALIWTAIGSITFSRRAVRDIFGIPPDPRSYLLLKATDFLAAAAFGTALLVGWALTSAGTWALDVLFTFLGWSTGSVWFSLGVSAIALVLLFALNTAVLAVLVKFLTGTALRWRRVWPGAILGGTATAILQIGAGLAFTYTPTNVLLATFAVFIGLLLWFRLVGIVVLVAASWMAVSTIDADMPLVEWTEEERRASEHRALAVAAKVRLRDARERLEHASWYSRWGARREVAAAERALSELEASAPPPPKRGSLLE